MPRGIALCSIANGTSLGSHTGCIYPSMIGQLAVRFTATVTDSQLFTGGGTAGMTQRFAIILAAKLTVSCSITGSSLPSVITQFAVGLNASVTNSLCQTL